MAVGRDRNGETVKGTWASKGCGSGGGGQSSDVTGGEYRLEGILDESNMSAHEAFRRAGKGRWRCRREDKAIFESNSV